VRIPTGKAIRNARNDSRFTQAELATRADVSQPLITRIESGDVDPTLETLYTIVSALNDSESAIDQEDIELLLPSPLKNVRFDSGVYAG
jgi:predicted transcriptional regulator